MERWTPVMPSGVGSYRTCSGEGGGPAPELLEDLGQIVDQPRVAQFQGDLAVGTGGYVRDGAVEDDQPLDELFQRPDLDLALGEPLHVGECALAVPDGVLIQRANTDTAVHHGPAALQRLGEHMRAASAAGLDREHSVRHSAVERSSAALIRLTPSSTVMAWVVGGS